MASSFGTAFKSFWHTMTSYDRHSTYDSPFRTGRHVPLTQGSRMGVLTSVATASESRADITSPYTDESRRFSTGLERRNTAYEGAGASPTLISPDVGRPYSPGLRSEIARRDSQQDGFETQSPAGEIPMQSFQDGLPPPPPASHTWQRIDAWAEENYPELYDNICEGCTNNDLNELEHALDCSLPQDVRESLMVHDGQERFGQPTGLVFSSMLMDCEEIVQEWDNWRKVNNEYLIQNPIVKPAVPMKAFGGSSGEASSSRTPNANAPESPSSSAWRQDLINRQDCVPPGAVQKAYSHPAWIPLVRDWGGNYLAVDLAPGPAGSWGQVILYGRDYDTKYVVARSWSAFLAIFADDLNSGKWFIDEDNNELKLREFKTNRVEPNYFDILRWRMDQKYGRRMAKRKSVVPGAAASPTGSGSPYASPTEPNGEPRGRPLQRLSASSPLASPSRPMAKSSPLARVTEEMTLPELKIPNGRPREKLVEVETPRPSGEEYMTNLTPRLAALTNGTSSGLKNSAVEMNAQSVKVNGKQPAVDEAMKTIEI